MPRKTKRADPKADALRELGTLNPKPGEVRDELFAEREFFDPRDLVQVKYEMLRRVHVERDSVVDAVARFGVSRPTFYKAQSELRASGLAGLLPEKRGPRGPHKLTTDVLDFIEQRLRDEPSANAILLAEQIKQKFKRSVHPRTVGRALAAKKKKLRDR